MNKIEMVKVQQPIHIMHDTYKRECRYLRGLHIPAEDLSNIVERMNSDGKAYFEFHNVSKKINTGEYFNGHASLARAISDYYATEKGMEVIGLNDGKDFYVKVT